MQYDVKTPAQYLELLEHDWRRDKLEQLRALIKTKAPHFTEAINYKMLSYGDPKGIVFHLNAQKHYVSLYVGNIKKIDPDGSLLKGIEMGKGCLRFKKSTLIAETRIAEFIERSVGLWKEGQDMDC